jgi:predicted lysophospholipase L1 biosynthesis ABC-type transport system permease subunit
VAGERARYFLMSGHDDIVGVLRNMGLGRPSRMQLYFTASAAIAVVNSVVGGTAVGFAVGIAFEPVLGVSVLAGAAFAAASLAMHMRVSRGRHVSDRELAESLFPSPDRPST